MKRTDFNKEIKITSLIDGKLLGLELKSILYTPNKYRIPVAFSDRVNSADDTEKYISEAWKLSLYICAGSDCTDIIIVREKAQ